MRLAPPLAVQIHVLLGDIEPTEWRRLLVRREYHLGQLHHVIQAALGWRRLSIPTGSTSAACGAMISRCSTSDAPIVTSAMPAGKTVGSGSVSSDR